MSDEALKELLETIRHRNAFLEAHSRAMEVECERLRIENNNLRATREMVVVPPPQHEDDYVDDERRPQK